jgi:hypothetical protein
MFPPQTVCKNPRLTIRHVIVDNLPLLFSSNKKPALRDGFGCETICAVSRGDIQNFLREGSVSHTAVSMPVGQKIEGPVSKNQPGCLIGNFGAGGVAGAEKICKDLLYQKSSLKGGNDY